jgi:hypothetical protein
VNDPDYALSGRENPLRGRRSYGKLVMIPWLAKKTIQSSDNVSAKLAPGLARAEYLRR